MFHVKHYFKKWVRAKSAKYISGAYCGTAAEFSNVMRVRFRRAVGIGTNVASVPQSCLKFASVQIFA